MADMSAAYRRAVLLFLHAHAFYFWDLARWEELLCATVGDFIVHESGVPWTGQVDCHDWIEATVLVRRLRELEPSLPPAHELRPTAD
jgi:hypothetical protein